MLIFLHLILTLSRSGPATLHLRHGRAILFVYAAALQQILSPPAMSPIIKAQGTFMLTNLVTPPNVSSTLCRTLVHCAMINVSKTLAKISCM